MKVVEEQLKNLAPGKEYYVAEDNQIVAEDASCFSAPVLFRLSDKGAHHYLIKGYGSREDPYRAEEFTFDSVQNS